eukprot:2391001-Pleurochrysis_carterae.AAC.1
MRSARTGIVFSLPYPRHGRSVKGAALRCSPLRVRGRVAAAAHPLLCCGVLCADADHHFTIRACDWGFREFVTLQELRDANSGFLLDDKLMVSARVRVEPQVNWWNWDSKKETGYVGLKNQGATCYMNSLLQSLTHIPYFRKVPMRHTLREKSFCAAPLLALLLSATSSCCPSQFG